MASFEDTGLNIIQERCGMVSNKLLQYYAKNRIYFEISMTIDVTGWTGCNFSWWSTNFSRWIPWKIIW